MPQATKKPVQKIVINSSRSQKAGVAGKSKGLSNKPPKLGVTNFRVKPATPGRNTGTVVGNKVGALRDDLRRLQTSVEKQNRGLTGARTVANANSRGYHERVASMRSKLQLGTTPGDPVLVKEWNSAQAQLEKVNNDLSAMTALSGRVVRDLTLSAYILDATKAHLAFLVL